VLMRLVKRKPLHMLVIANGDWLGNPDEDDDDY